MTVVIPTRDRLHTLKEVLPSYLAESDVTEVIVVVDGAADGTEAWVRRMALDNSRIRVLRWALQRGVSAARNAGLEAARGRFALMGEDDLYLAPGYVSRLVDHLIEGDGDLVAGRIVYLRPGESEPEAVARSTHEFRRRAVLQPVLMSVCYQKALTGDVHVPTLHAISIGETAWLRRLAYDESFSYREESELCLRACAEGRRLLLCAHTHCVHLARDRGRGGGWGPGRWRHHVLVMRHNARLVRRHESTLKSWGMKGNRWIFLLAHMANRIRLEYQYQRYAVSRSAGTTVTGMER